MEAIEEKEFFMGVDPGKTGSICFIHPKGIYFLDNSSTPGYLHQILTAVQHVTRSAYMEDNHAIFGSSAGSTYKFGYNTGITAGIILAAGYDLKLVPPKVWQSSLGIQEKNKKLRKLAIADAVMELYGDKLVSHNSIYGPKGGLLDGRSDALAIAHYSYTQYTKEKHGNNP